VKTTIEIDEEKLKKVMKLTGIKTRKEAVDFALTEAERVARIEAFYGKKFYVAEKGAIVDPEYDVIADREKEKPGTS
jgi:hypothetical protein